MAQEKKQPAVKESPATQKISKDELAALIKKAAEEDPDAADPKKKPAKAKK